MCTCLFGYIGYGGAPHIAAVFLANIKGLIGLSMLDC